MAEAVVSFLVQSIGDSILTEAKFLASVSDQVEDAKAELQRVRCLLEDADTRARQGDNTVRNHVAEIREAAYDLDDAILTFSGKEARNSASRSRHFSCFLVDLHRTGSEIERISAKMSKSRSSLVAYGVATKEAVTNSELVERQRQDLRRTFSHYIESDFVGFGDNVSEVVACLTSEASVHRVVSVCGMGGLGKTTLARQVYFHPVIRKHFHCFAWVCVSQKCQPRDIWEGILVKLVSLTAEKRREIKEMTDSEISKALFDLQKEKRCLVVLDDIWTTLTWDCLKSAFPGVRTESKLLFTTRNRDVALHADRESLLHEPKCFNDAQSWELFAKKAQLGKNDSEEDRIKENLGRNMLEFCGGLPLAITVLGGLLSNKETVEEWQSLHKDIKTYMRKGKINEQEDSNFGISWVLGLSFDELPYYLKPCFLHLAYYPEDYEIRAKELCRIWVAEGFVSTEERAYECLSELVERCILQVPEWGSTKRIKVCRIHNLMRDLCLAKAREDNFLRTLDLSNRYEAADSSTTTNLTPTKKVRRLAVYMDGSGTAEVLSLIRKIDSCVRSLMCFNREPDSSYYQVVRPVLLRFRLLRVLKFENLGRRFAGEFPTEIGKLIHLRLFSLRDSCVQKFPESIGDLRRLETLDLRVKTIYNDKSVQDSEIPPVLWKLEQLRHLYLPQNHTVGRVEGSFLTELHSKNILRLENLANLKTVVNVSANYSYFAGQQSLANLTKLKVNLGPHFEGVRIRVNNLRSLAIYFSGLGSFEFRVQDSQDEQRQRANFGEQDVFSLISNSPFIRKLHVHVPIAKLPKASEFSPNLIKLTLVRTCLEGDPMVTLEKLPSLRILFLDHDAFKGNMLFCSKKGFPRLESLYIGYINSLEEWEVEEGALPSLERLHIVNCLRLKTVPEGLRHVITLKEMVIQHMLRQFKRRTEQGGEDFYKVQHVPSLTFMNTLKF